MVLKRLANFVGAQGKNESYNFGAVAVFSRNTFERYVDEMFLWSLKPFHEAFEISQSGGDQFDDDFKKLLAALKGRARIFFFVFLSFGSH